MAVNIDLSKIMKLTEPEIVHGNIETSDMVINRNYNLIAKDGVYASSYNGAFRVNSKIVDFGNANVNMDSLGTVEEGVELTVDKIPFKYYMMVLDYFRAIHRKQGTEAGVTFFVKNEDTDMDWVREKGGDGLIEDGDLIVYCPYAKNTGSEHTIEGEEVYEYLRTNAYPLVEVHSHHTMGIQWSGVDDANMRHFRGYTVFNHIHHFESSQTRTYIRGQYLDFPTSTLFELPWNIYDALSGSEELGGNVEFKDGLVEHLNSLTSQIQSLDEFPESWMERGKSAKKTYSNVESKSSRGIWNGYGVESKGQSGASRLQKYRENMNKARQQDIDSVLFVEDEEDVDDEFYNEGYTVVDDTDSEDEVEYIDSGSHLRQDGVWEDIDETSLEYDSGEDTGYRTLGK